ncbi:TolC family protein [Mangrovibacterium sp.]|uniref:TolC family protein n=1 Tax=Mangrovibacterium sp. TaxID=1961364 RepID=UPI00356626A4
MNRRKLVMVSILCISSLVGVQAQTKPWSLNDCIDYAIQQNIQVRQSALSIDQNQLYSEQAKAAKLPNLSASASQNFFWSKDYDSETASFGSLGNDNSSDYGLNSSVILYNGNKLNNEIKLAELDLKSSTYNTETIKESVQISVLNYFLQVLYAQENVSNAQSQIESTEKELELAEERLNLGLIAQSDLLQIKSELASEKLALANAKTTLGIARLNLMQLMELPSDTDFEIESPELSQMLNQNLQPVSSSIFEQSLQIRPQIKMVESDMQLARLNEQIAKASYLPTLSLSAGLSTGYSSSLSGFNYTEQLKDQVTPSVGLSLSVPIFQRKQAKTSVGLAKIAVSNAELTALDTQNSLRKEIEQAALDVQSAQIEFEANEENFQSVTESMNVANEKFNQGLINSVDFLYQKNLLITAESQLLQSKYQLIFSYKILDFYKGIPLSL